MEIHVPEVWNEMFQRLFDTEPSGIASVSENGVNSEATAIRNGEVKNSRVVVLGGNRVGKSTYNRWLINKLLCKLQNRTATENDNDMDYADNDGSTTVKKPFVVYIDLDPAQAEFTPPGVISVVKIEDSVHGANHTHLRKPLLSKFLGTLNVADISSLYMKSAKELIDYVDANEDLRNAPVVINTMGFCRGIGLKITCTLLCLLKPSIVIQILWEGQRADDKRSFPWLLKHKAVQNYLRQDGVWWKNILGSFNITPRYQFLSFNSVFMDALTSERNRLWTTNAKELRDEVIVSYFQQLCLPNELLNIRAISPITALLSSIVVATMDSSLTYDGILRAMNGNLVALCSVNIPSDTYTDITTGEVIHNVPKMLSKASMYSNICHGYGVVRSIDREAGILFIVTPLNQQELQSSVNCIIAAGKIGLPVQFYFGSGLESQNSEEKIFFPYLLPKDMSVTRLNEAASRRKVDKRVMPRVLKQSLH